MRRTKNPPKDGLMTGPEVCKETGYSRVTIWKWIKNGTFPKPIKPGGPMGMNYFIRNQVQAFMEGKWPPREGK